ncbi:MAG: hypothetical protein FWH21_05065 [Kiritimatiellaeota bacterium]|nr:hypothetical protein [Kiritimatiellota bacterium]
MSPRSPLLRFAACAVGLALIAGCASEKKPDSTKPPPDPAQEVVEAERLLEQGRLQDATIATVDIVRKNPQAVGLADLQFRIQQQLAEERMAMAEKRSEPLTRLSTADAKEFGIMPEMYRTRKHVMGENTPLYAVPTPMQEMLLKPVSVILTDADLNLFIQQIGETDGINMIADANSGINPDTGEPNSVTIRAENVPLIEILEFLGRNLGVIFNVGNNLIWVIPDPDAGTPPSPPLETRFYKLRKGLVGSELGRSVAGGTPFAGVQSSTRQGQQQQQQPAQQGGEEGSIGLLDTITRFVPQPEGADIRFDDKVHVLIVKNTRENLDLTEQHIEALDKRPLQVLIEARFIQTTISDLRDLGIEWMLDNRNYPRLPPNSAIPYSLINPPEHPFASAYEQTMNAYNNALRAYNNDVRNARNDRAYQNALRSYQNQSAPSALPNLLQFAGHALTSASDPSGSTIAYQFLLGNTALQATLHALETTGNAKTIVVPRVTTLNNREASFRVGEDTTYFDDVQTQISSTTGGYGNNNSRDSTFNYNRPSTVETGYSLIVTPSVGADLSSINLILRPEISKIKEWKKYTISTTTFVDPNEPSAPPQAPSIEIPTLSRQYIETEVVIRSGETIVLGGLANTLKQEDVKGTPWLSRIPLIGYLFKTENKQETYENILIFVTATVLSEEGSELIPLNESERYGVEIPEGAAIPNILKTPPADTEDEGDEPDVTPDADAVDPLPDALPLETPAPAAPVVAPEAAAAAVDVLAELLPDPDVPIPVLVPPVPVPVDAAAPVAPVAPVAPIPVVPVPAVVPVIPVVPADGQ